MFYDNEDMFEDQGDFDQIPESISGAIQVWQQMLMRKLVEENFNNLATKGFSQQQLMEWDEDSIEALIKTFDFMIAEFEAEEDYEKCAILVRARQSVIDRKAFEPTHI